MTALLLVDLQKDFMPGGALAVPYGHVILPIIDKILKSPFTLKIATKDWHPPQHKSFASAHHRKIYEQILLDGIPQILWPDHCVQNTEGSEFAKGWDQTQVDQIIYKGTEPNIDSYSAFYDNEHRKKTPLEDLLKEHYIKVLFIAGLATDYCVKYSVIDALKIGYEVYVVVDGCKAVNLSPQDEALSLEEMKQLGANLIRSEDLPEILQKIIKTDKL